MKDTPCEIWTAVPENVRPRMETAVKVVVEKLPQRGRIAAFFRADDIGVPDDKLARLMAIFQRHNAPLALSVVPEWLTPENWTAIREMGAASPDLWCWHQHGLAHVNHEFEGKRQEFGPSRSRAEIRADIEKGRERLLSIMGEAFFPAFTPPWNRCGQWALDALSSLGFLAVSRFQGATPPPPAGLAEVSVNLDPHTRKDASAVKGWQSLSFELTEALASGVCGVMIHHHRMNDAAFDFMEMLLDIFTVTPAIEMKGLPDLIGVKRR